MLMQHIARHSDPQDPEALVFTSAWGRQLHANAFRRHVLKPALKKAGMPAQVRTHDLRHTAAAICISAGVHPKKIQEMLGHSSITVTLDIYGYLFESLHQETADLLDVVYRKAEADADGKASVVAFPQDEGAAA
jgi:site-specific recombinase XerD